MTIKIVLADDHRIVLEGLRSLLAEESELKVIAEARNGRTAVRVVKELSPDVAVLDISMPGLNGIEAARQIHAECPRTGIVGLSMHADQRFVAKMLKAGASAYVLKDCAFEHLARAIRAVYAKRTYLSPPLDDLIVRDYIRLLPDDAGAENSFLSPREREVLQLTAEGERTIQIAGRLAISVKTVETHRSRIMKKIGVDNVAELTKYAIREGITSAEY